MSAAPSQAPPAAYQGWPGPASVASLLTGETGGFKMPQGMEGSAQQGGGQSHLPLLPSNSFSGQQAGMQGPPAMPDGPPLPMQPPMGEAQQGMRAMQQDQFQNNAQWPAAQRNGGGGASNDPHANYLPVSIMQFLAAQQQVFAAQAAGQWDAAAGLPPGSMAAMQHQGVPGAHMQNMNQGMNMGGGTGQTASYPAGVGHPMLSNMGVGGAGDMASAGGDGRMGGQNEWAGRQGHHVTQQQSLPPAQGQAVPKPNHSDMMGGVAGESGGAAADGRLELVFPRRGRKAGEADRKVQEPVLITMMVMQRLFHLPLAEASKQLGLSPTAIKGVCRRLGIKKWPFRMVTAKSHRRVRKPKAGESGVASSPPPDGDLPEGAEVEAPSGLSLLSAAAEVEMNGGSSTGSSTGSISPVKAT